MLYTTMKCPLLRGSCAQSEVVITITSINQYSINRTESTHIVDGFLIPYDSTNSKKGVSHCDVGAQDVS